MAPENTQLSAAMLMARLLHLSITLPNGGDDDRRDDGLNFEIDPSLLVDHDKLTIGEVIGAGNDSIVHKGLYKDCPVAVKTILPENTNNATPERKKRFQKEVNLMSKIQHRNIVKFIGASMEPSMMIITELVEGGSLQKNLRSMYPTTMDLEQSLGFALDISKAMEYLHANGIIHRDLKPGNLLLTGNKMQIKLADFGIARDDVCDEMTSEAGTYRYMAPELLSKDPLPKGAKIRYDHKVDVYSFAIVLWSIIKSQIPFEGMHNMAAAYATLNNVRPSVEEFPQYVVPLLQSCWAEDPKLRPEFKEITEKLWELLDECVMLKRETRLARLAEIEMEMDKYDEEDSDSDQIEVDSDNDQNEEDSDSDQSEEDSDSSSLEEEEEHQSVGSWVEHISKHDVDDGTETVKPATEGGLEAQSTPSPDSDSDSDSGDGKPKKKSRLKRLFNCLFSCFAMPAACKKKHGDDD